MIFEVLSEKTEAFDRGAKFAHYRSIPSLRTYVLVSQEEARVEWYERDGGRAFVFQDAVGQGATIELLAIGISLPIAEIYANLPE